MASATEPRFAASYDLLTAGDPALVAQGIAGEQSCGTFVRLPQESEEMWARSGARVEALDERAWNPRAGLQTDERGRPVRRFGLRLSWPLGNTGASLPNLLATAAGNLFELREVAGLVLEDLDLPPALVAACPGPAFGIAGTRRLAGVEHRPLIGTIIKPSIGLTPTETAELVDGLCAGGIDFIKDDELQADGELCSFEDRIAAVLPVIERHADRTGRKVMYAANVTGDLDEMLARCERLAALGGTCAMVSLHSVGLTGFTWLRRRISLPIHAHRNGWGYLGRFPRHGFSYVAWQKIWRLAGADHLHVNGLANKFWEPDDSVIASARACLTPLGSEPEEARLAMPVFSSGQTVRQMPGTLAALDSSDFIFCAGGGIAAHPGGVAAGVRALRDAWEAASKGVTLDDAATTSPDLKQALEHFR